MTVTSTPNQPPESSPMPPRLWREWFWRLASLLKVGGVLAAFWLSLQQGWPGAAALAATVSGIALAHTLEATSRGD